PAMDTGKVTPLGQSNACWNAAIVDEYLGSWLVDAEAEDFCIGGLQPQRGRKVARDSKDACFADFDLDVDRIVARAFTTDPMLAKLCHERIVTHALDPSAIERYREVGQRGIDRDLPNPNPVGGRAHGTFEFYFERGALH